MKLNLSRQTLYMLIIAFILLILVFIFAFVFLIPVGKEYRLERIAMKKEFQIQRKYQEWHDETYRELQNLRTKHKSIIEAYDNTFNPERFIKISKNCFESLTLTKQITIENNSSEFSLYEVNATSKIDSPENFYTFIEQINKGNSIVKVNFPIHFEREGNLIRSSFKMRVYLADKSDITLSNETESLNR